MTHQARGRWMLALIVVLFAGSPLTAWWAYSPSVRDRAGAATTNAGTLFTPARALPDIALMPDGRSASARALHAALAGHWTLLLLADPHCARSCRTSLAATRRVRALLHTDARRVARVLVIADARPAAAPTLQPDLAIYRSQGNDLQRLCAQLSGGLAQAGSSADCAAAVYLVDPLGNAVLYYPPPVAVRGMLDDLSHLLHLSQIG